MYPTRTSWLQSRTASPRLQYPLLARSLRRNLPPALSARAPGLQYRFSYTELAASVGRTDNDPMIVVEALDEIHRNRQAMLGVLAQLRGDDATEQVW